MNFKKSVHNVLLCISKRMVGFEGNKDTDVTIMASNLFLETTKDNNNRQSGTNTYGNDRHFNSLLMIMGKVFLGYKNSWT